MALKIRTPAGLIRMLRMPEVRPLRSTKIGGNRRSPGISKQTIAADLR